MSNINNLTYNINDHINIDIDEIILKSIEEFTLYLFKLLEDNLPKSHLKSIKLILSSIS